MPGLSVEERDGVRHLVLNRPERRNPLTRDLRSAIDQALDGARADGRKVLLFRSVVAEPPVFAAGADLREIGALRPDEAPAFAEAGQALFRRLEDLDALVLAAVDGPCFGGALDLALSCDQIAASPRASFAHPGARLGIVTGWGGTRRLPRRVGGPSAAAAFASGRSFDAETASGLGLVQAVLQVTGEAFLEAASAWAGVWALRLQEVPSERIGTLKRVLAGASPGRAALESAALLRYARSCRSAPSRA